MVKLSLKHKFRHSVSWHINTQCWPSIYVLAWMANQHFRHKLVFSLKKYKTYKWHWPQQSWPYTSTKSLGYCTIHPNRCLNTYLTKMNFLFFPVTCFQLPQDISNASISDDIRCVWVFRKEIMPEGFVCSHVFHILQCAPSHTSTPSGVG